MGKGICPVHLQPSDFLHFLLVYNYGFVAAEVDLGKTFRGEEGSNPGKVVETCFRRISAKLGKIRIVWRAMTGLSPESAPLSSHPNNWPWSGTDGFYLSNGI